MIGPNCVFQTDYDGIELQKIAMTSSQSRTKKKNVTKITSQFFSNLGLSIKISGYASVP